MSFCTPIGRTHPDAEDRELAALAALNIAASSTTGERDDTEDTEGHI